jgi:hypothetical protein
MMIRCQIQYRRLPRPSQHIGKDHAMHDAAGLRDASILRYDKFVEK